MSESIQLELVDKCCDTCKGWRRVQAFFFEIACPECCEKGKVTTIDSVSQDK